MTKRANNRGRAARGVNPQGFGEDVLTPDPKSKLENAAKRVNKK